jgi:hypothetical protein
VAGNVGSGASQEIRASGIVRLLATTPVDEWAPKVVGRTMLYLRASQGVVVDLGTNQRWDDADASCLFGSGLWAPYQFEPLDSTSLVYSDGYSVRVRRAGPAGWCSGETETSLGSSSGPSWSIYAVSATHDAATGRLERVAWAENDLTATAARIWTRDAGADGRLEGPGAPAAVKVLDAANFQVTRFQLGGDAMVVRGGDAYAFQMQAGDFTVLSRPPGGWGSAEPITLPLSAPPRALAAAVDSTGRTLAYVTSDVPQTLHLRAAGADGAFGTADDVEWTRSYGPPVMAYGFVAVEGGHVLVAEYGSSAGTGYLDHWTAGPDGRFGTDDDHFARLLPSPTYRSYPSLGTGLSGGLAYYSTFSGTSWDLAVADLSAFRWETLTDVPLGIYPRTNRAGTFFFRRNSGVWARAPDGQETLGTTVSAWSAGEGASLVTHWQADVLLHRADAAGRFFTAGAPAPVVLLAGKAGALSGASYAVAIGDGRALAGGCEATSGWDCTEASLYLFLPAPTLATPVVLRTDRPADGAPAGSSMQPYGDGFGISAEHAAWSCQFPGLTSPICVREPGPDGAYGTIDDIAFILRQPGTTAPYQGITAMRLSGHRMAFLRNAQVVVLEAGPDGHFNTADDVEIVVGPTTQSQGIYFDVAGDFVAWSTVGATGGMQVWLADVRLGTSRQVTDHYSGKYQVVVEPTGRVLWEDQVFPQAAVFVSAP